MATMKEFEVTYELAGKTIAIRNKLGNIALKDLTVDEAHKLGMDLINLAAYAVEMQRP